MELELTCYACVLGFDYMYIVSKLWHLACLSGIAPPSRPVFSDPRLSQCGMGTGAPVSMRHGWNPSRVA